MKNKVVVWGYKLGTHTHSYINWGFYRTFKYLGYDTYWVSDSDDVSTFDFSNCIFLAEGNSCHRMPLRRDSIYFLHNCPQLETIKKRINFQYYHKDCLNMDQIGHGIAVQDDCVYFAWNSPLLPKEFDKKDITNSRGNNIYYIGTLNYPEENGNYWSIVNFAKACSENGHPMYVGGGYTPGNIDPIFNHLNGWISVEDEAGYYRSAYMAPALQGENQITKGYVPCRLFKSISYGCDGITTNPFVYEFFEHNIIFDKNPRELYFKVELSKMQPNDIERRKWLFNFVKEKHTYIQNINALMSMI